MYMPNARTDEVYNEKYLKPEDKMLLKGYDFAFSKSLSNVLDNLDPYDFDIDGEDLNLARIFINHPKILEALKQAIDLGMESDRNDFVISILEGYDGDEYQKIKETVDAAHQKEEKE